MSSTGSKEINSWHIFRCISFLLKVFNIQSYFIRECLNVFINIVVILWGIYSSLFTLIYLFLLLLQKLHQSFSLLIVSELMDQLWVQAWSCFSPRWRTQVLPGMILSAQSMLVTVMVLLKWKATANGVEAAEHKPTRLQERSFDWLSAVCSVLITTENRFISAALQTHHLPPSLWFLSASWKHFHCFYSDQH